MIKELGYLQEATINILAEDSIAFDTPFMGRFGLSMLLELKADACEKHILYDTNSAAAPILHNLKIMASHWKGLIQFFFPIATMIILMDCPVFSKPSAGRFP